MEETIVSSVNQCSYHQNQLYQFYCRDCKDCVCVECLPALHKKHVFCNIEDAEDEIRQEMRNYITDNQEENKKLNKILDILQQKIDDLASEKIRIEQDIQNLAENMKRKIEISKKELISSLEAMCEANNLSVFSVRDRVQRWQLNLNKIKDVKVDEYSFLQVVDIVGELRRCIKSAADIDEILKRPILQRSSTVCNIGMLSYKSAENDDDCISSVSSRSTVLTTVSVHTQTENYDDVDTDVEWFDAEDFLDSEYACENSSDELNDEYPLTIKLDNDKTNISKIVPVSSQDAWVIANTNLQKIQGLILEKEIFAKLVDDIAVMGDGSVLVLNIGSQVITRLLPNKRLVRFVSVSSFPHCLCTSADKPVRIALRDILRTDKTNTHTNYIVKINQDGIQMSTIEFEINWTRCPFLMETFSHDDDHMYVLYHRDDCKWEHSTVMKISKSTGSVIKEFNGVCGMKPAKDFKCYGILCDSDNILVSDSIHHKIYTLNKDLKFTKCIVDASHGLESPNAIALNDNLLWVSDRSKILIFKYDQYK